MSDENAEDKFVRFDGPDEVRAQCSKRAREQFETILACMEEKTQREIKAARECGEIYIEQPDIGYWKIHDKDGYYAGITSNDWIRIREFLDKMDRSRSETFLQSTMRMVIEIMCNECNQRCDKCRINDLLRAIGRKMPRDEYCDDE